MAATQAKLALGTIFKMASTAIEEIETIGGPAQKVATVDVTNMDSPSQYAEYIAGIIEGGEITLAGNWINSTAQKALLAAIGAAATAWSLLLPGTQPAAGHWGWNGFVAAFNLEAKHDKQLTWTASIKVTGPVTYSVS
jgi:predicted secreted protein